MFNPFQIAQAQMAVTQQMMQQGMEFSQAALGAQAEAIETIQTAWVSIAFPAKPLPEYTVKGKIVFPAAFVPATAERHA